LWSDPYLISCVLFVLSVSFGVLPDEVVAYNRSVVPLNGKFPTIFSNVFIAPNAVVIGEVDWDLGGSLLYGSVVRGDNNSVVIGCWSHINEGCVISTVKTLDTGFPAKMTIGNYCFIGSNCTLTSCDIGHRVIIEDGVVVCEGAVVEEGAIIRAGSVVPPGRLIGEKEIWAGNPAEKVGDRTDYDLKDACTAGKEHTTYIEQTHQEEFLPYGTAYWQMEAILDSKN